MTKKEQAHLDDLQNQLRLAKALSWTQPVAPDVPPPADYGKPATRGYSFNAYGNRVQPACSKSNSHYNGEHKMPLSGSASKGGVALYSTKLLALQALRHAVEKECAARLAAIDKQIEDALSGDQPLPF